MKTITDKIAKVMKTILASLIIMVALSGITKGENSGNEAVEINSNELTIEMKSWMVNSEYWSEPANKQIEELTAAFENSDNQSESQELAQKMKLWITNSSSWDKENDSNVQELALEMKSWMNNNSFWHGKTKIRGHQLAMAIRSWISNSSFWNEAEEPINSGNILANN